MSDRTTRINLENTSEVLIDPATEGTLKNIQGFQIPIFDYISLSYTSTNLTGVVYKTGGSTGATVATLTLAYDISNQLISVTKS